jgi:hypothetical protein
MLAVDNKNFPDYAYCPINQSRKHRKDAKIQFVALIVSKPEVGPDKRLQWKVVDRTGEVCTTIFWKSIMATFPLRIRSNNADRAASCTGKFLLPVSWIRL